MLNNTDKPICIFMVGIPYSGKSTYIAHNKWLSSMPIVSVDDEVMKLTGNDYTQWSTVIEKAAKAADQKIHDFIEKKISFVIDKTNLSALERQKTLTELKNANYQVAAIVFPLPDKHALRQRANNRPEKVIPREVLIQMTRLYQQDLKTLTQEFDAVLLLEEVGLCIRK